MQNETILPHKDAIHNRPEFWNYYRMLLLSNPAHEHTDSEFKKAYGHENCALFAKAITRELTLARVKHHITVVLKHGSMPVHWYITFNCNKSNKRAYLDAYGITYNESSIHKRYGLNPADDETALVDFLDGEVSPEAASFRDAVSYQIPKNLSSKGIANSFDQIVIKFADLMMETLATDNARQNMLFEALYREATRYKNWLNRQSWFSQMDSDQKEEMVNSLDSLIRGLKPKPRLLKPNLLWERAVDHWMETGLEHDQGPDSWQWIYSQIDHYRASQGIMCSHKNIKTDF